MRLVVVDVEATIRTDRWAAIQTLLLEFQPPELQRRRFQRALRLRTSSADRSSAAAPALSAVVAQRTCRSARANASRPHSFARAGCPASTSASRARSQSASPSALSNTASPRPEASALPEL